MKRHLSALAASVLLASPIPAQEVPSPNEIVAAAKTREWVPIAPDDLLVMDLAPAHGSEGGAGGEPRRVVIQLIPPPFSQGWVDNIRTLARAHWWDGTSVNRVQDNYVAQWGDATEKKPLPPGLKVVPESEYVASLEVVAKGNEIELTDGDATISDALNEAVRRKRRDNEVGELGITNSRTAAAPNGWHERDSYAEWVEVNKGWPLAMLGSFPDGRAWPVHCYATVGVGRNLSPDTGTGAELYAVIGHAPRHLDRNIAVVGRVIEGIEHLSSLPRGSGPLGFYENPARRVSITSIRLASDLPEGERPRFEYLNTESPAFARYADARANRRDPFFIVPAGGADICNIPVPVRRHKG